jgi:hypothetical protein
MAHNQTPGIVGWLRADPKRIVGAIITGIIFPLIVLWLASIIFDDRKPPPPKKPE